MPARRPHDVVTPDRLAQNGLLGVVIFSGSLPATRLALQGFEPLFLTYGRATIAGMAGAPAPSLFEQKPPLKDELAGLAIVTLGVVKDFRC